MSEKIIEVDGKRYLKVQKGKYFDKNQKKKMKKHHPVRWILITCLTIFVVAPVGFLFGAFFDPSTKEIANTTEKFSDNFMSKVATGLNGMTDASHPGVFTLDLDNDFIDSTLYVAQQSLLSNETLKNFIDKLYVNIDGENYDFVLECHVAFFKTKLHLKTVMTLEERDGEQTYVFKMKDIVLGRLPLGGMAKSILPTFVKEDQINAAIRAIPLNANISINNMEITYKKQQIKNDISTLLTNINSDVLNSPLSNALLSLYSAVESSATFKDKISISIDFSKATTPQIQPRNAIPETELKGLEDTYRSNVKTLLNNKKLSDPTKSGLLFQYFLTGYTSTLETNLFNGNESLKNACTEMVGKNYNLYFGDELITTRRLTNSEFYSKINDFPTTIDVSSLTNGLSLCKVSDENLSNFFRNTSIMGYTFGLPMNIDNQYVFSYVSFDDFNANIEKSAMNIIGSINLNGTRLPLTLTSQFDEPTQGTNRKLGITPKNIYIGENELSKEATKSMIKFLGESFTNQGSDSVFSFDKTKNKFVFDVSNINISASETTFAPIINNIIKGEDVKIGETTLLKENFTFSLKGEEDSEAGNRKLVFFAKYNS